MGSGSGKGHLTDRYTFMGTAVGICAFGIFFMTAALINLHPARVHYNSAVQYWQGDGKHEQGYYRFKAETMVYNADITGNGNLTNFPVADNSKPPKLTGETGGLTKVDKYLRRYVDVKFQKSILGFDLADMLVPNITNTSGAPYTFVTGTTSWNMSGVGAVSVGSFPTFPLYNSSKVCDFMDDPTMCSQMCSAANACRMGTACYVLRPIEKVCIVLEMNPFIIPPSNMVGPSICYWSKGKDGKMQPTGLIYSEKQLMCNSTQDPKTAKTVDFTVRLDVFEYGDLGLVTGWMTNGTFDFKDPMDTTNAVTAGVCGACVLFNLIIFVLLAFVWK